MSARGRYRQSPRLRTDWFRVLIDLQYQGWGLAKVAAQLDIPLGTLRWWKQGGEPNHADGTALLELWAQVTGRETVGRPMVRG